MQTKRDPDLATEKGQCFLGQRWKELPLQEERKKEQASEREDSEICNQQDLNMDPQRDSALSGYIFEHPVSHTDVLVVSLGPLLGLFAL